MGYLGGLGRVFCIVALALLGHGCASILTPEPISNTAAISPQTSRSFPAEEQEQPLHSEIPRLSAPRLWTTEPTVPTPSIQSSTDELSLNWLVQAVLNRNPTIAQMTAAWQAASARYPQVTSLEDPVFSTQIAPPSFGSNDVTPGYNVQLNQKYPFPGKLGLRGQSALAEASAAGHDLDDVRLQLVESVTIAFYEYYLVERSIAVNDENLELLHKFRRNAEIQYENGRAPQQDVLQADVEIARQQERQLVLRRMRAVAIARINTLMHFPPDAPLPHAPRVVTLTEAMPDACQLRAEAVLRRPDLKALVDRIVEDEATLALARKEFAPDFELMAAYNTLMGNGPSRDLAPQVGLSMNLPVRRARRWAAVAEAESRLAQRRAELARQTDQVYFQVQETYEQIIESEKTVRLYEKQIVPAAEANVKSAQAAYVAGSVPFLSLISAQRELVMIRDRSYEAIADYYRRRAVLERVTGGPLHLTDAPPNPDPK